ncbi:unnamed protein product [Fraxinus pennsylvanica]|uniref:Uncharacterized protein n=1 Tax=Fraxinus pennsylvanica TaxID=56036 RepID=A0AAD2E0K6_9LAMI|nr:unnamed protein product [Fraxinus pennsylvanica]
MYRHMTCPFCHSTVIPSGSDVPDKIYSVKNQAINNNNINRSLRNGNGSFEYIVNNGYNVSVESTTSRLEAPDCSIDKQNTIRVPDSEVLAREVSIGRNWMMDYIDGPALMSMSSHRMLFRNSSRFFSCTSRRNDYVSIIKDLEANRFDKEISNFFQWLSRV